MDATTSRIQPDPVGQLRAMRPKIQAFHAKHCEPAQERDAA
jgi:hypothetical protein